MESIKKRWPFLIGLILSFSLLWPLFAAPLFNHHDDIQAIRLYEMDRCFKDGQIPCRWVPDLGNLYGYPLFNYYAPLPYYFGELIYFITSSLIISVKVMFAAAFLGSFLFMYLFARKFWGTLGGSLSAIFYSLAPYHALDFYVRGAMGEMWGLMFVPAVFWAIYRLFEKVNVTNLLLVALFIAGLITAHNLSAMLFLPVIFLWVLFLILQRKISKFVAYFFIALFLGIALSSFYLFPMLFEKDLVHVDTTTYGYFSYTEHFKGIKKLMFENFWGYGASVREVPGGEKDGMSFQIGWMHILGWITAIAVAYNLWKIKKQTSLVIIFSSLIIIFSIIMINPRSQFIWKLIEPLKFLQFPWRLLMVIIFFASFVTGSIMYMKTNKKLWVLLVVMVYILNFAYFKPEKFIFTDDGSLLQGQEWERQVKRAILDYLPIYAKEPPAELAKERLQVLTGDSRVYDYFQGSDWIKFKTDTKTHTIIRISQYYFPEWKVFIDGKEGILEYQNNNLGLMTIILGQGNHDIYLKLFDTKIRSVSNLLSFITAVILLILFIVQFKKIRGWLDYYRKRVH